MSTLLPWSLFLINAAAILFCLFHCWRRDNMYRPFHLPGTTVRLFWTVLLITFSPIAWLAYLLFGLCYSHQEYRTNTFHTVYTILIVPFCVLLVMTTFPQQKTGTYPQTVNLNNEEKMDDDGNYLKFHAGMSKISTNSSSSASTMSSNYALFSFRKLVLVVEDNHPIITGTIPLIIEKLKETSYVDEIVILNSIEEFPKYSTMPDYWMRLQLEDINESGLNVMKSIQANVRLDFTLHPFNAIMRFYHDEFSFPTSAIEINANADVNAKVSVFGTAGSEYKDVCKDIAKNLTAPVMKQMNEMVAKYGLLPDINDQLMTDVVDETQPFSLFSTDHPVLYGKRPLIHSIAQQKIPSITPANEYMEQCQEKLELDGWEIKEAKFSDEYQPRLKAQKDQWKIIVYAEKPEINSRTGISADEYETMPMDIYIEYMHVLSDDELDERYQSLLHAESPAELLMYFQNTYRGRKFRDEFYELLQTKAQNNPSVMVELARHEDNPIIKHEQLYKAFCLNKMIGDPKDQNRQIEKDIKKLEEKHNDLPPINWDELCQSIGAQPAFPDQSNIFTAEVGFNQPVAFYCVDQDNQPQFFAAHAISNHEYKDHIGLKMVETQTGSSSWGSSHQNGHYLNDFHGQSMYLHSRLDVIQPNRFSITLTLKPNDSTPQ